MTPPARWWLPSIVKAMGNLSTTQVGFIVPIPYLCAAAFVFFWSRHSDRTGERVATPPSRCCSALPG